MTYVTYDGLNACGAVAVSKDLTSFKKKGIITPKFILNEFTNLIRKHLQNPSVASILAFNTARNYPLSETIKENLLVWDKNVVLFPKKINGKFVALHRLFPSIQIVSFEKKKELTVEFWKEYLKNEDLFLNDYLNNSSIREKYYSEKILSEIQFRSDIEILNKLEEKDMQSSRKGSYLYTFNKEKYEEKLLNNFSLNL